MRELHDLRESVRCEVPRTSQHEQLFDWFSPSLHYEPPSRRERPTA